ncbi:hypothetical protein CHLRE_06g279400v5 [Chlamydomonas reinhardtii]|uniref:Carboxypeptidase n=1 Tax=Chlamydomonas reinhardtii TaxID=3055 RepID=A8J1Y2_CHLRE|nr:uncharacterized protein CHLRE_06g279400v5 [Chlamydomonas reinhardtii]PNW82448.1 hypothetical protein CHLRE_06g279400v5 [Chlamydomonas reinhardtii]|eukprot:XP_001695303.1 predicted protein [Chlamydomonas reinhardtii]
MRTRGVAALVAAALCCLVSVHAQSSRLVEKELNFAVHREHLEGDVPLIDPPKRIAGYFKLNRTHDARMFYFYFQSRHNPATDPVVLWMTGGPGCSSEIAIFFENGPYSINEDRRTLNETTYGWDTFHNMIFVDQPIGTGFSYSNDGRDRVFDEGRVGRDMLDFLYEFYRAHPEVAENPFYVTGESYAGHYVPAVSSAIYRANELGTGPMTIPLAGLAIGNGMTNPTLQFPAYADFALENKLISQGLHDSIQWWMPLCQWGAEFCDTHQWRFACIIALEVCQMTSFERILGANPDINVYDITKKCDGPLCYDMSAADDFLNRPEVRKQLGVGNREWSECDMGVNGDFMGDWLRSYDDLLPAMMEDGIHVMIYAGDLDLICNWVGNQRWVDALQWERSGEWPAVAPVEWEVTGAKAGTVRELGTLSFVRVYQAGHMVPMDQPQHALAMLWRFTRNQSLTAPPEQLDPRLKQRLAAPRPQLQTQVPHTHKGQGAQQLQSAAQLSFVKKVVEAEGRAGRKRQDTYRSDKPLDVEQQPEEELRQEVAAVNVVDGQEMGAQSVLGRHGGPQEGAAME